MRGNFVQKDISHITALSIVKLSGTTGSIKQGRLQCAKKDEIYYHTTKIVYHRIYPLFVR